MGHAPLSQYFSRLWRQTSPFRPRRARIPDPVCFSPAYQLFSRDDKEGAIIAWLDPKPTAGGNKQAKAMSPSWHYFSHV